MMRFGKGLFHRIAVSTWMNLILLTGFSAILVANSLVIKSTLLGIVCSVAFLYMNSVSMGKLFFFREPRVTRIMLGLAAFLTLLTLAGVTLIFAGRFTSTTSLVAVVAIGLVLFLASRRRKSNHVNPSSGEARNSETKKAGWLLLIPVYFFFIAVNFYLLTTARTNEGGASVWLTIPNLFVPTFFVTSLLLGIIVLFTNIKNGSKLVLIMVFSFLVHSLFIVVWYPGRYGDPWTHLAEARYIDKAGMPYAYDRMISGRLFVDILKYRAQSALVVFFERMFYVDIYWSHIVLVPLIWAVLVPLLSYKTAELLSTKKSLGFPLLAALSTEIFSSLIIWGAVSVPNSLGFLFFFLTVALFLYWTKEGGRWLWILVFLASVVSFFAHPQTGVFAFMLLFWGTIVQRSSHRILKILSYFAVFTLYPLSMYYFGARPSLTGLVVLSNFIAFQSEIGTILLVLGLVGLILGVEGKYVSARNAFLLFAFYLTVVFEYYATRYGLTNLPFSPGRILAMGDLLLAPFLALGLVTIVDALHKRAPYFSLGLIFKRIRISTRPIGIFLICLFLSLQVTASLYKAYPSDEIVKVQPSEYAIEAAYYIDSTASGNYAVICSPWFAGVSTAFLGVDYSYYGGVRGWFGVPEFGYPLQQLYLKMIERPSINFMKEAMEYINADISYFVVSVVEPDFNKIVQRVSDILPVQAVFGDGKLYIFKYPLPLIEEPGPNIKTFFDENLSAEYVPTNISYMYRSEANSTVLLTGHSSYNITEYPLAWTFLELTVNNVSSSFDPSSNVDKFIYKSGLLPTDVLSIKWSANLDYEDVGWKDDSFDLSQWHRSAGSITPTITSDGNILQMSWNYVPPRYNPYYYVRECNVSTDDFRYIKVRWKSTGPIAAVHLYFGETGQTIVPLGSESYDWTVTTVQLESNQVISFVMVGITNLADPSKISGVQSLFVDYILIGNRTT